MICTPRAQGDDIEVGKTWSVVKLSKAGLHPGYHTKETALKGVHAWMSFGEVHTYGLLLTSFDHSMNVV